MSSMVDAATGLLSEWGISVAPVEGGGPEPRVELRRAGSRAVYLLRQSRPVETATWQRSQTSAGHEPVLHLIRHATQAQSEELRDLGVEYLDSSGNAHLHFGDVFVDVRGRRPRERGRRPTGQNPFSGRRSRVAFVLLAWPQLWEATNQEIADAAGVSMGTAHQGRLMLREAGLDRGSRQAELLDRWSAAWIASIGAKLTLGRFHARSLEVQKVSANDPMFCSGEAAVADLVRPISLLLYVPALQPRLAAVNRWRTDGPNNVTLREAFWSEPGAGLPEVQGIPAAPWPLVYADLRGAADPRLHDVARVVRERHVDPA
ncbi:type IV toxin-antitoxin system AbiEi family antitoxin [Nocardioides dubius]